MLCPGGACDDVEPMKMLDCGVGVVEWRDAPTLLPPPVPLLPPLLFPGPPPPPPLPPPWFVNDELGLNVE
jgi:hypothetical protein